MCKDALAALEPDAQTTKRAQYEAFEFSLEAPGLVRVINGSYGDDGKNDHSYRVNVENGVPAACECKAFEYRDGACKHLVAVAIREPVLEAAADYDTPEQVATDGGAVIEDVQNGENKQEQTDHWQQPVRHYDDPTYGPGERGECRVCGSRHIKLYAATEPPENGSNDHFEEFYRCDCGAEGSFRHAGYDRRTWTGSIRYPEA